MRTASAVALGLLVLAVTAFGAAAAFVVLRDDSPPERAELARDTTTTSPPAGEATIDDEAATAIADRLVARLAQRSGVRVTDAEGRCLAMATLDALGVERLAESVRTGQPVTTSSVEEAALLRAVIECVDTDRATLLLQIPTDTVPGVPLPGDEP